MDILESYNEARYTDSFYEEYDIRILINGKRYIERYIGGRSCCATVFKSNNDIILDDEKTDRYFRNDPEERRVSCIVRIIYETRWEDGDFKLKRVNASVVYAAPNTDGTLSPEDMKPRKKKAFERNEIDFCELMNRKHEWDFTAEEIEKIKVINERDYQARKERIIKKGIEVSEKMPDQECRVYFYPLPEVFERYPKHPYLFKYSFISEHSWKSFEEAGYEYVGRFLNGIEIGKDEIIAHE